MRSLLLSLALALAAAPVLLPVPAAAANDGSGDGGSAGGSPGDASGADGGAPEPDCSWTGSYGAPSGDPLFLPEGTQIQDGAFGTYCANFPAACTDQGVPGDVRYYCLWHPEQCIRPAETPPAAEPAPAPTAQDPVPVLVTIPVFAPGGTSADPCVPRVGGLTAIGARGDSTSVPGWGGCRRWRSPPADRTRASAGRPSSHVLPTS